MYIVAQTLGTIMYFVLPLNVIPHTYKIVHNCYNNIVGSDI